MNSATIASSRPEGRSGRFGVTAAALLSVLLLSAGCSSVHDPNGRAAAVPLRVAITADYPPLVSKQGELFQGAEIDLAEALGRELGRPVEFIPVRRDALIPTLVDGRADIVMAGMSITRARQLRIVFSDAYLHNQLRAVFPRKDADQFQSPDDVLKTRARIGVVTGTTADVFVQQNCPDATRVPIESRRYAAFYLLKGGRIDLFIDDTIALAQIVSENEADLAALETPLAEDELAWGLRPDEGQLLDQVNAALKKWKADGTLTATLQRWMPYLKQP
jgi:polar amino acid transport system substrate-binding protein